MSVFHPTFISHAHADNDVCDRYVAALRARGIDIWYDRNNAQAGHFLGTDIQRELQQRTAFVLLMTQQALDSFWVQLELQAYLGLMAQDRSRILLPVRIGPCHVPPILNAFFWIDAQEVSFDQAIDAIVAALTARIAPLAQTSGAVLSPVQAALPSLGPTPAPTNSVPAHHLTPISLYNLGYRGYTIDGVECILPPVCPVPAGNFTMGSDQSQDRQARDNELPQHECFVTSFALSQHPVTVAEYALALQFGAVREPPKSYGLDWQKQKMRLDHPVVCVSYKDGLAYSTWLKGLTQLSWRLPSEAEWEKAARGTDGRIYPWGDEFNNLLCNTIESRVGTTTPVGSFPEGESPFHLQDMAGNVWEWMYSKCANYPYVENDGREDGAEKWANNRVLRGSSWNFTGRIARTAYRNCAGLNSFNSNRGFRLALSVEGLQ